MSDDVEFVSSNTNPQKLRSVLIGRDQSLTTQNAVKAAMLLPRRETLLLLRGALETGTQNTQDKLAILSALGRLGDDKSAQAIIATLPSLSQNETLRAARSLAQYGGKAVLSRLAKRSRDEKPRIRSAFLAAQRMIAYRTSADIDLPREDFAANIPLGDARTGKLKVRERGTDKAAPEGLLAGLSDLVAGVKLRSDAAVSKVDCVGSAMWLAPHAATRDVAGTRRLLAGRNIIAALVQYDHCGSTTYPRYLVGFDPAASEILVMAPDGRVTHRGSGVLGKKDLAFELSAAPISRAMTAEGRYNLETGKFELSGRVSIERATIVSDPSAIMATRSPSP